MVKVGSATPVMTRRRTGAPRGGMWARQTQVNISYRYLTAQAGWWVHCEEVLLMLEVSAKSWKLEWAGIGGV